MPTEANQHVPILGAAQLVVEPPNSTICAPSGQYQTRGEENIAIDKHGELRWSIERPLDKSLAFQPQPASSVRWIGTCGDDVPRLVHHLGETMSPYRCGIAQQP